MDGWGERERKGTVRLKLQFPISEKNISFIQEQILPSFLVLKSSCFVKQW